MPDSERPGVSEIALRFGLVVVAFIILWRVQEPTLVEIPAPQVGVVEPEQEPILPPLLAALSGVAAGALFGLAGRPRLTGWTFHPGLPVALGLIPAMIVAVQLLVFAGALPFINEGLLGRTTYFLVSDFSLRIPAILLGVALAQGVVSVDTASDPGEG